MLCIFALPALSAARAADGAPLDDAPGAVREVLADRGLQVRELCHFGLTW